MSIRVEVEDSRQVQQGAARREREGETGSWPSKMPQHPGALDSHCAPVTVIIAIGESWLPNGGHARSRFGPTRSVEGAAARSKTVTDRKTEVRRGEAHHPGAQS